MFGLFFRISFMAANSSPKKLYRSDTNRVLAGVCGGIGEYTNIDPTVVRVLFIIFGLMSGWGILAYIILALVIPQKP